MKRLTIGFQAKRRELLNNFASDNNYIGLTDIINGSETTVNEVYTAVYTYLDETCDNGHYSRWTNHGSSIASDADAYVSACLRKGLLN